MSEKMKTVAVFNNELVSRVFVAMMGVKGIKLQTVKIENPESFTVLIREDEFIQAAEIALHFMSALLMAKMTSCCEENDTNENTIVDLAARIVNDSIQDAL